MKKFVVSLASRQERRRWFDDTNHKKIEYEVFNAVDGSLLDYHALCQNGFDTNKNWIDPIHNTHITSGEVGCFISHYMLWKRCIELNEPVIILEDDGIITDRFSEKRVEELLEDYNFAYLGWLEMENSTSIDDELVVPKYPYWTLAYALTPEAAKILVQSRPHKQIIPVDEYLPTMMKSLNPCGYRDNVVTPVGRNVFPSDVDPVDRYKYFIDFRTHVVTVADDDYKCNYLYESVGKNNFKVKNLGKGIEWKGSDMSGPGGGQKVNILRSYLNKLPNHDVVLFMDGFDTFAASDLQEVIRRYLEFKCKVLFAAERYLWPDESLEFPECGTPYKYLNSGLYIGRVDELKKIFADPIEDHEDDQLYFQKKYLSGEHDIKLDHECYVFQCNDPDVQLSKLQLYNPNTFCYPCLYHGNGGTEAKDRLEDIFERLYGHRINYLTPKKYEYINDDMLLVDYMTPTMCEDMIRRADADGEWGSLSYDKFPAQEIRLKKLGLWEELQEHWNEVINPIIEYHWKPMQMYGMRDAFVMRYSLETQKELALHTDASLVTGSVKLNDDYEGGELIFPRQKISNKNLPIGKMLLFPGAVTHGHACTELLSGVKYSLTMWTSRYEGDVV